MKNSPLSLKFIFKSAEHPTVCFWGAKQGCFQSFFSNGTSLTMENFPWQLTAYGKFSLVSCLSLEKNLATYQGLAWEKSCALRPRAKHKQIIQNLSDWNPNKFHPIFFMSTSDMTKIVCFKTVS